MIDDQFKNKQYLILFIFIIGVILPRIGLVFSTILLLIPVRFNYKSIKIIGVLFSFCVACLAFSYIRLDNTGDIYMYQLVFSNMSDSVTNFHTYNISEYEKYYYFWTLLQLFVLEFSGDFKWVSFISIFLLSYSLISIIGLLYRYFAKNNTIRQLLFLKVLIFYSFISVFTTYKSTIALVIITYSILLFVIENNKIGSFIWGIIAIGFHPVAIVIPLMYFLSTKINMTIRYMWIILLVGIVFKPLLSIIISNLPNIPFLSNKLDVYVNGDWASYRFHERGEYLVVFQIIVSIVLYMYTYIAILGNRILYSNKFLKLVKFSGVYLALILLLISFRTFSDRFSIGGMVVFFPCFSLIINNEKKLSKKQYGIFIILLFVSLDLRNFTIPFNPSYIIGEGFPVNMFDSIFTLFI